MRKKKLIERIEQLEKAVEFLSNHNNDEFVQTSWNLHNIKYLYNGEVKCVHIHCDNIEVIENLTESAIVRGNNICFCKTYSRYYKIDKAKATVQEIPKPAFVLEKELSEKEASAKSNAKKSTEKKSSK